MPQYSFFIRNQKNRAKYPRSFDLPDVESARNVALRIARTFVEVVPYWDGLSTNQRNDFTIQIADEAGETVLAVPFREIEEQSPDRAETGEDTTNENEEAPPGDGATDGAS